MQCIADHTGAASGRPLARYGSIKESNFGVRRPFGLTAHSTVRRGSKRPAATIQKIARSLFFKRQCVWKSLWKRSTSVIFVMGFMGFAHGQSTSGDSHAMSTAERPFFFIEKPGAPRLAMQLQPPSPSQDRSIAAGDVVYVHGATFGANLSIFYRFQGRSWADALNDIGLSVWGFDFAGYGNSDRYPPADEPVGRMNAAVAQLRRVVHAVREKNGDRPVALVAHSWGASVAARYAGTYPQDVKALVLFAPIVMRTATPAALPLGKAPATYPLSLWSQYRRFIEDVPRGSAQVLDEADIQTWGQAYLASDPEAGRRMPPAVTTPFGPVADIGALWSGHPLYDPSLVNVPTLLIRGAWDSLCTDADAARLLAAIGSSDKADSRVDRATHLMHLESARGELHQRVNVFLARTMK